MQPRIEGINAEAVAKLFTEAEEYLTTKHLDELDYRNLEWYIWRANLKYLRGNPAVEIVDDLFMAARCVHKHADLHLGKHPAERFLTRRVIPVELGLISGVPMITLELASRIGLPLMMLLADDGGLELHREASLLTRYFKRGSCTSHQDVAGLGALVYAGSIAAIARGFDDEAALGLNIFSEARAPFAKLEAKPAELPFFRRYDLLNLGLVCLIQGDNEGLTDVLTSLAENYTADLQARLGEAYFEPRGPQRYFDLSVVAFLASSVLRNAPLELPETGAIAPYRAFVEAFTTAPQREIEAAQELTATDRMMLKAAGIDPEIAEANLKRQAADQRDALEEAQEEALRSNTSEADAPTQEEEDS